MVLESVPLCHPKKSLCGLFLLELSEPALTPLSSLGTEGPIQPCIWAPSPHPASTGCCAQACPLGSAGPQHLASLRELQPAQRLLIK